MANSLGLEYGAEALDMTKNEGMLNSSCWEKSGSGFSFKIRPPYDSPSSPKLLAQFKEYDKSSDSIKEDQIKHLRAELVGRTRSAREFAQLGANPDALATFDIILDFHDTLIPTAEEAAITVESMASRMHADGIKHAQTLTGAAREATLEHAQKYAKYKRDYIYDLGPIREEDDEMLYRLRQVFFETAVPQLLLPPNRGAKIFTERMVEISQLHLITGARDHMEPFMLMWFLEHGLLLDGMHLRQRGLKQEEHKNAEMDRRLRMVSVDGKVRALMVDDNKNQAEEGMRRKLMVILIDQGVANQNLAWNPFVRRYPSDGGLEQASDDIFRERGKTPSETLLNYQRWNEKNPQKRTIYSMNGLSHPSSSIADKIIAN